MRSKKILSLLLALCLTLGMFTIAPLTASAADKGNITVTPTGNENGDLTLTAADVDDTLTAAGVDRESDTYMVTITGVPIRIHDMAFEDCSGMTSVVIPNSVKFIHAGAFAGCSGLSSITFPSSLEEIHSNAFNGCTGLNSAVFPGSLKRINISAFHGCTSLTSVTIPASVTDIESEVFDNCDSLTEFIVGGGNLYYSSQDGVLFDKDMTKLVHYPGGKTGGYIIPDGVETIGNGAFSSCAGLTGITIPDSVENIESYAFYGCTGLSSVSVGSGVTDIGDNAFNGCTSLTNIYMWPSMAPTVGSDCFEDVPGPVTIYTQAGALGYDVSPWSGFTPGSLPGPSFDDYAVFNSNGSFSSGTWETDFPSGGTLNLTDGQRLEIYSQYVGTAGFDDDAELITIEVSGTVTISDQGNDTNTGLKIQTGAGDGANADVTLKDVCIDVSASGQCAFSIPNYSVSISITLLGTNTLTSGDIQSGLAVCNESTLTITSASTGSLTVTGGSGGAAGIGITNSGSSYAGTINIYGGEITAIGGSEAGNSGAGIGGGNGGAVTISGPNTVVTATGGDNGYDIGSGTKGSDGYTASTTLSGSGDYTITVTFMHQTYADISSEWVDNPPSVSEPDIIKTQAITVAPTGGGGGGVTTYTVIYNANGGAGSHTASGLSSGAKHTVLTAGETKISREGYAFTGWNTQANGGGTACAPGDIITVTGSITLYAQWTESPKLDTENHLAYVVGYEDGSVRPQNNITRAEASTIFFRLLTQQARADIWSTSNSFADVNAGAWYNNAVSTLSNDGILKGYDDGNFRPQNGITRAEFATIAVRFADTSGVSTAGISFSDIAGHWAEQNVKLAAALGYVHGDPGGTFRPNDYITRAEVMTLLNRVLNRHVKSQEDMLADMAVWPDNTPDDWFYFDVQEATNSHYYNRKTDGVIENWAQLRAAPDWNTLEKPGAKPSDVSY